MMSLSVEFIVEEDRQLGKPVFHVFPTHRPHDPELTCNCRPRLLDMYEWAPGLFIELWWHGRKDDGV
jgi:hypothetical protein